MVEKLLRAIRKHQARDFNSDHPALEAAAKEASAWLSAARAQPTPPAVVEPLEPVVSNVYGINERIQFRRGWRAAEAAHGIGIKKENGNG